MHAPLDLPAPTGPHELAWSYLLDGIFADAYAAGVGDLRVSLPIPQLQDLVELRAALTRSVPSADGRASALLGADREADDGARTYVLGFGSLAARTLRRLAPPALEGWTLATELSVFTLESRLWGLPIRAAGIAGRPDLVDRGMRAMRCAFARSGHRHAYYHLAVWERS